MPSGETHRRRLGDRFEIVAQLGAGAMGEVYRARDCVRGQDVALKLLPALDATSLLRFKNEFHALHDVQHPNLVRLHELYEDHGTWFFTMQLVDGVELFAWIGTDEARLREVLPQIAQALHRLHADGLVHRDVKPSNVLVTPAGRAMLLDFGLVAPTWSPGEGVGTPAFMAPEQVEGDIGPAADWYAFGVLLFRALTGRVPFVGSADEVMQAKGERAAPRLLDVRADAPADLARLADALLSRRAVDRPSGEAVLAMLGAGSGPTRFAGRVLVGRDRELAELRQAVVDRMAGDVFTVQVIGESGIGKTALLRALAEETETSGTAWVLTGRCWERESVPYKGFDGVIDELAARLDAEEWALPDDGWSTILVQAFPVLRRVPAFAGLAPYSEIGGHETPARVSGALRSLLAEIATHQPLALIIDDLQWADRDTLALLRAILEPSLPNVFVCFGARAPLSLDWKTATRTVALAPLSAEDTASLVGMVVRELGGDADPHAIAREAGGHPLLAAELARHVVATGELDAVTLEDAIVRTAERAGSAAKHVATIISLAHAPLSIEAVERATGHSGAPFFDALTTLRTSQLVATSGVGAAMRLEPYHDRIRATLIAGLADEERTSLHTRIAEAMEATGGDDSAALARHWEEGGQRAAAVRHALRAAEQAEAALAFHRAARLYAWVTELSPTASLARIRHAECLAQAGLGVAAADVFLACARDAAGAEAIALRRRAMQQLLLMGHTKRASELLDELMRWLDLPNPTTPRRILLGLVRYRVAIRLRRAVLPPNAAEEVAPMDRARLDVLFDAAVGLSLVDPLRAFYFQSMNVDWCFRIGDRSRITRALMSEVPYLASRGKRTRRLDALLALADQAAMRTSFPAVVLVARGSTAFFFGRWRECRDELALCVRLLQQDRSRLVKEAFGPAQLLDLARRFELVGRFFLGELPTLRRLLPEHLQDALERNDVTAATHLRTGIHCLVHLAFGDVDTAVRDMEAGIEPWRNVRVGIPHFMDTQARSLIDIYLGRPADAHRRTVEMWPAFRKSHVLDAQYVRISLLDVRGRAAIAAATSASVSRRDELLVDAKRCADELRATGAAWAHPLAHSLRAGIATVRRRDADARAELEWAASAFDGADMPLFAANARMVRAMIGGDAETASAQRRVLTAAGIVELDRYSRLMLPRV
ncbi:MAG: protein kinase domain-containing protein [Kofleriaceae bacterium]